MALTDVGGKINETKYSWYYDIDRFGDQISDYLSVTAAEFGTGKKNTETMIAKWDKNTYGEKNQEYDMWEQIQTKVKDGWFVPSKGEWAAFAGELRISDSISSENYYEKFEISDRNWSSSLNSCNVAWCTEFYHGKMIEESVTFTNCVRLSATF